MVAIFKISKYFSIMVPRFGYMCDKCLFESLGKDSLDGFLTHLGMFVAAVYRIHNSK